MRVLWWEFCLFYVTYQALYDTVLVSILSNFGAVENVESFCFMGQFYLWNCGLSGLTGSFPQIEQTLTEI